MNPGIYRHYKGNLYHVLGVAIHSETEEQLVVYRDLYGSGNLWIRPLDMFKEKVQTGKKFVPRFTPINLDHLPPMNSQFR